jgi:ribosomal protein S27AE
MKNKTAKKRIKRKTVRRKIRAIKPDMARAAEEKTAERKPDALDKAIFDFIIAAGVILFLMIMLQMITPFKPGLMAVASLLGGGLYSFFENSGKIAQEMNKKKKCGECGFANSAEARYCGKCGRPLHANLDNMVRVYSGNEAVATIIMQELKRKKIAAWKNTLYRGIVLMPTYIYVFAQDAEKAGEVVKRIVGQGD